LTNKVFCGIIIIEIKKEVIEMNEREMLIAMLERIGATYYTGISDDGIEWIEVVAGFERAMCFNFNTNGQTISVD
jgi:hypothetical protein